MQASISTEKKRGEFKVLHKLHVKFNGKAGIAVGVNSDTAQFEKVWIAERVWCVTSTTGNIITRRNGRVTITGNTEGFDDPAVTVGLMARPTKSGLLYRQSIGRVLRPSPSPEELAAMVAAGQTPAYVKERAIVIDFCDLSDKHVLHTAPTLFGLNSKLSLKGKTVSEAAKEIEEFIEQKKLPLAASEVESFDKLKSVAQRVDLLGKIEVPAAIRAITDFQWMQCGPASYSLSLPDYAVLRVTENALGGWNITRSVKGISKVLSTHERLEEAVRAADGQVPADAKILLNGQSSWRRKPVTDSQINLLWKIDRETRSLIGNDFNGFSKLVKQTYQTAGAASDRINQVNGRRR